MSVAPIEPTREEIEQILLLKKTEVFEDADNDNHQYRKHEQFFETTVTYMCPDCVHADDKVGYYRNFRGQFVHDLTALNGGGIALPADSPFNPFGDMPLRIFCFAAIQTGEMKDTKEAIIGGHGICGAARGNGTSIFQQVELLLVAREDVESGFRKQGQLWQVVPHYHVCYGQFRLCPNTHQPLRKTKRINLNRWLVERERHLSEIRALKCRKLEDVLAA